MKNLRSVKISSDTDFNLLTLQLFAIKKYNLRLSKGALIRYSLKALAEKMKIILDESDNNDS